MIRRPETLTTLVGRVRVQRMGLGVMVLMALVRLGVMSKEEPGRMGALEVLADPVVRAETAAAVDSVVLVRQQGGRVLGMLTTMVGDAIVVVALRIRTVRTAAAQSLGAMTSRAKTATMAANSQQRACPRPGAAILSNTKMV